MRLNTIRLALAALALTLCAGDSFAGPILERIRARRAGGTSCATCAPSHAPAAVAYAHAIPVASAGGCANGKCPLPR